MKKVSVILLMMLSLFFVNDCLAQNRIESNKSHDNNRGHLKVDDRTWNTQEEEVISKKRTKKSSDKKVETIVVKEEKNVKEPQIKISNPCFEDMTVEFVSLQGNRASQEVTITISFTNHDINKNVYIRNFNAYNEEGDNFSVYSIGSYSTLTDIKQKTNWKVGQMLPSKNSKLTAVSFKIDDCVIEMRDLPIDWR